MAGQQCKEFEETITCPVCLARYDEQEKKPKYLVSCCHTVCLFCLERISQSGTLKRIGCPICRCPTDCSRGVDCLPTNGDKIYLLKLDKSLQKSEDEALNWCFTCRKKTSVSCSVEKHSIMVMNPQLLDSDIQLNLATISSGLHTYGESILQNRIKIDEKLDRVIRWLCSFQEMVKKFKTANAKRISQLTDMIQGTDITISIQKLMQLSINKEADLGLLSESIQEEKLTKNLLREFESIEKTADIPVVGRFRALLDLPSLPCIQREFAFDNFFPGGETAVQWPLVLMESLIAGKQKPGSNDHDIPTERERTVDEGHQLGSRYFSFQFNEPSPGLISNSGAHNNPSVFRFGTQSTGAYTSASSSSGAREVLSARRRRRCVQTQTHSF